ncbi:MAG: hypothetical protein GF400_01650, partial [Candidatus Eisenbacteria bacterium]|nr:hypothetical protein [Candidatus Eisenbacteria bacterium]
MVSAAKRMGLAFAFAALYLFVASIYLTSPPAAACVLASAAVLGVGAFVLSRAPGRQLNRAFCYFCLTLGAYLAGVYLAHMAVLWGYDAVETSMWLLRNGPLLVPLTTMYFTYRFIEKRSGYVKALVALAAASTLPFVFLNLGGGYVTEFVQKGRVIVPANALGLYRAWAVLTMFWSALSAALIAVSAVTTRSAARRRQYLAYLAGLSVLVATAALAFVSAFDHPWYPPFVGAAMLVFPVLVGFAVLRYGLFDIKLVIRRTMPYALALAAIGIAHALVFVLLYRLGTGGAEMPRG